MKDAVAVVKSGSYEGVGEFLSSRERQGGSEARNVPEVEGCSFCDLVKVTHPRQMVIFYFFKIFSILAYFGSLTCFT